MPRSGTTNKAPGDIALNALSPDLAAFLEPLATLMRRAESRHAEEGYIAGLLADPPPKTVPGIGLGVA